MKDYTKKEKAQMKKYAFIALKDRFENIVKTEKYFPDFGRYENWDGSVNLGQIKDLDFRFKAVCLIELYNEYARLCGPMLMFNPDNKNAKLANFFADLYNEYKEELLSTGSEEDSRILYRVLD
jgi:hypothetical protein